MADEESSSHQSKPPPGLSLAPPAPAEPSPAPPTAAQQRAYRNRSSGSWFDATPATHSTAAAAAGYGGKNRRINRDAADRAGPGSARFPPPPSPPPQQHGAAALAYHLTIRPGTVPLEKVPLGTRCTGVVSHVRGSFGFIA